MGCLDSSGIENPTRLATWHVKVSFTARGGFGTPFLEISASSIHEICNPSGTIGGRSMAGRETGRETEIQSSDQRTAQEGLKWLEKAANAGNEDLPFRVHGDLATSPGTYGTLLSARVVCS